MDVLLPELCIKSLAGPFTEGTARCTSTMDLAEMYPDRPAEMCQIACNQCRSLSEDPRRRTFLH